jgi:hypothetical protein
LLVASVGGFAVLTSDPHTGFEEGLRDVIVLVHSG